MTQTASNNPDFEIRADDLSGRAIAALLEEHLQDMHSVTPEDSVHAMDLRALQKDQDITFWTLWENDELLGCGALKRLGRGEGEIKSMRTADSQRRRGVGACILRHIVEIARAEKLHTLYLETGSMDEFGAARALYERFGFQYCRPFADYVEDHYSVFMRKTL